MNFNASGEALALLALITFYTIIFLILKVYLNKGQLCIRLSPIMCFNRN